MDQPTALNLFTAMYSELYWRHNTRPRFVRVPYSLARAFLRWLRDSVRALVRYSSVTRRVHQRSIALQFLDMMAAFNATGLRPEDYYAAQLARKPRRASLRTYIPTHIFPKIVVELQRESFGEPPFPANDKAEFGRWCRANAIPSPLEIALGPGFHSSPVSFADLGTSLFVKPRCNAFGRNAEAWERDMDGDWRWRGRALRTAQLFDHLISRARLEPNGLVIQQRLSNHKKIADLCGNTLSTCRIITALNKQDMPEIGTATDNHAIVDNFHGGGIVWLPEDIPSGRIAFGLNLGSRARQDFLVSNPITGVKFVGKRHPFWGELCRFALEAHGRLGEVVLVGWDIAMTPDGPVAVEMNWPCEYAPGDQILTDGFEETRIAKILGPRVREWIDSNIDASSRRRVGANLSASISKH